MRRVLAALLLSLLPATALAGSTLEAQVAQATWQRTVSSTLQGVAAVRVIEIQTTFAHRPMPELAQWSWGEVIAWNTGYADPIAQTVTMWRNSPTHWAVLRGAYSHIGCASDWAGARFYAVCLLGNPPAGGGVPPPPAPPITHELPNAATDEHTRQEQLLMLMTLGLMLGVIAFWSGSEMAIWEAFLNVHPEIRRKFEHFRTLPKPPDPHICPTHGMKVRPGQKCWVGECEWRSPQ